MSSLPPGVAAPPGVARQPTPAAMPQVPAAPMANGHGTEMSLEEFREFCRQMQTAKPGKLSLLMRANNWSTGDKATKLVVFTIEGVPPGDRERYMQEAMMFE
jgi:hypothetical protein